ncbi:hypothetical protein EVAR_14690_1 [Eumeta japonica]|uniref:Uncharacterized protein n=1 Tax=Eumeta variegata TaxID=151549 RepID=A0A4C1U2A4_EUMVA|nr:hypothetical protein EVAR_14690_1 [Eumeta japonica]
MLLGSLLQEQERAQEVFGEWPSSADSGLIFSTRTLTGSQRDLALDAPMISVTVHDYTPKLLTVVTLAWASFPTWDLNKSSPAWRWWLVLKLEWFQRKEVVEDRCHSQSRPGICLHPHPWLAIYENPKKSTGEAECRFGITRFSKKTSYTHATYARKMSTKKRKYGLKSRFTMESLLEATERIKSKEMTTRQASVAYNIPRTTLVNKLHLKHMKSVGRPCILTDSEEESLVQNIFACIESGLQISLKDVRFMVKDYLDRSNKTISFLRNNMPSLEWAKMFLDKHEDLKSKISYERKRKNVTQKVLRRFFYALERDLENILPENIFNFIELKFCDNCKTNSIMYRKQDTSSNAIKSDFTVIFCANALGYMTPPYIIYKGTSKCEKWLLGAPVGTRSSATLNGWLNEEAFSDWFHKIVLPLVSAKDAQDLEANQGISPGRLYQGAPKS